GKPRRDRRPPGSNPDAALERITLRLLFIADAVGTPGRKALEERLAALREELGVDFCVVNGENLADGVGITPKLAERILAAGADVITLGNHVWRRSEIVPYLNGAERVKIGRASCRERV